MTVTVLSGPERRRRWTTAEKLRIVAESHAPGAIANDVARWHNIHPHQLHKWRQDMQRGRLGPALRPQGAGGNEPEFVPVAVSPAVIGRTLPKNVADAAEPGSIGSPAAGTIEMEFANGSRMRVIGVVDSAMLAAALAVMALSPPHRFIRWRAASLIISSRWSTAKGLVYH
jgi:transposase